MASKIETFKAWRRRIAVAPVACALTLAGFAAGLLGTGTATAVEAAARRGEAVFNAGGCYGCHTAKDGKPLAGGRALKTPFGTYYSPNITPDRETGIGGWTEAEFVAALREGVLPDGSHLFPVFPYTSYTLMTDQDAADLWAYLQTVPAVQAKNREHDTMPPFGTRLLMAGWKWLYFEPQRFSADPQADAVVNRGAYLVQALGHCGECHTPRGLTGAVDGDLFLAGGDGVAGKVPNITPDRETGIGRWSVAEITDYLKTGMTPDADFAGGEMALVIEHSTGLLSDADRAAIAAYLKSVPAIANHVDR